MSDIRFNRWLHQSGTGGVSQDSSGHIGIGTTVPTMALDVRGDVNIGNTININNASGIISATTFTGTTGTFSGDVTVGGTLTYEDVANIDAVGIITAQSDIIVGGGLTVTGISTFNNDVKLLDNDQLKFGIGEDLRIYHDGSINRIRSDVLTVIEKNDSEDMASFMPDGAVVLFHNGSQKFETTSTGAIVTGILTATTFSGNLTGNVTGDLTGNLAGISSIAAISSSISDTAVDVFVYDTRKDSDGGAWRKRTQHTSWYNETLNTATRGSRKEFPAVAVIVAESTTLTIYDGDDPDLPMWMVFTSADGPGYTGPHLNIAAGSTLSAVAALNGEIVVTCNSGSYPFGSVQINFLKDRSLIRPDVGGKLSITSIAKRNVTGSYNANYAYTALVNKFANDVAMTVLPNAPVDPSTGLPVPTIAVATNGGISIIKDDGTVSSKTITGGIANHYIDFLDNGNIVVEQGYQYTTVLLNYTAESQAYTSSLSNSEQYTDLNSGWVELRFPYLAAGGTGVSGNYKLTSFKNNFASAHSGGLVLVDRNAESPSDGLIAGITTSYNTGYMQGDIQGAFLSDTDTTNVTNTTNNVVTNPNFASDSNWTKESGWSITSGRARWTQSGGSHGRLSQTITLTPGVNYVATVNVTDVASNGDVWLEVRDTNITGTVRLQKNIGAGAAAGVYAYNFTAVASTSVVILHSYSQDQFDADDLYVYPAEEDRSVNNNGLQVFGTVTKSAVATGADLVAYSGFSNSNVLVQPYNSDLDPGTGDYSFMIWFKCSSTSGEQILMRRFSSSSVTGGMMMRIVSSSSVLQWYVRDTSSNALAMNSTVALDDGLWHCVVGTRKGNNAKLYIDGKLNRDSTCSASSHNPGTDANLVIGAEEVVGNAGTYSNPATNCSLALVRYSLSAPSAAQVKKMYDDEKVLFQENAKATLYGSSDAVTALGYDEDTELLHVGTSSGRSDFQGLRRINNTTTAVTTAISASDELIAEQ